MEVSINNIVKFLVLVTICLFKRCAAGDMELEEMQEKLDSMDEEMEKWFSQVDTNQWDWNDYKYEDRVGSREELIITDVEIHDHWILSSGINNWQILQHESGIYLAGKIESSIFLYFLDSQSGQLSARANVTVPEEIKSFKLINLIHKIDMSLRNNNIYLILSLESSEKQYCLKWFSYDNNLQIFQENLKWKLENAVQSIEYFNSDGQYKILLIYKDTKIFNKTYSLAEIYKINLDKNSLEYSQCYQFWILENSKIQVCPKQGVREIISVLSGNQIVLHELKDDNIVGCTLNEVQTINLQEAFNSICFESRYLNYLITLGSSPNFLKFQTNEYIHDKEMETFLQEIRNIDSVQSSPVNTYRDEVILFMQLKNSSVLALSWEGSKFKRISIPNNKLDHYDLSKATIIPNFGFLSGQSLVKVIVKLIPLPGPQENKIDNILKNKLILEEILDKQEFIINKTNLLIEQNYLKNAGINELVRLSEMKINSSLVNNTDFSDSPGSQNFTIEDIQSSYDSVTELINALDAKITEIENNLKNAVKDNETETHFQEIDIKGNLEIKGTLYVENLEIGHLNNFSMNELINGCQRNVNSGVKSFPTIELTYNNYKILHLNGKPLKSFQYEEFNENYNKNYNNINLSKLNRLEIENNLNVSFISGENWENIMNNLVFKKKKQVILGTTTMLGQVSADVIRMDYLNDIRYPYDYVVKSSPIVADMTGAKSFQILRVSDLQDVKTINGIDADEFIILNADQSLKKQITFENLVIDKSLEIHGEIIGLPNQDPNPDLTLLNSNIVQSDTMFTNLLVSGKVYIENSINGTNWITLDDIILKNDEDVVITGKKTFLDNVHFSDNLEIKSKVINQHAEQKFITLDTRQILSNLFKISGNFEFSEVTYDDLKNLEDEIISNVDDSGMPMCMKKYLIFLKPPIVDSLSSSYFNHDIDGIKFSEKLESLSARVYFEHLKVKKLIVEELVSTVINGVNFKEFENQKISKNVNQNLSGNITIKYLEAKNLYADLINNYSNTDLETVINNINKLYQDVFNGNVYVELLNVTGSIITSTINELDLNDVLDINYIEKFILRTNETIENIVVKGLINNLNFTKRIHDTVFKTEDHVLIKGPKRIERLSTKNLQVDNINSHSVSDIISLNKNQTIIGPVKIKGSAIIKNVFNCSDKVNNLFFKNISEIIYKLNDNIYKLDGNFVVNGNLSIKHLNVFGHAQDKEINTFMDNLIYLSNNKVVITGGKTFYNSVNFVKDIFITNNLNEIDLKIFYQNVVFIDQPISLQSKIVFEDDILLEDDLIVENNLRVNTIKGINIDDLMDTAVYINRPSSFMEKVVFSNVVFKSDITVELWNDVKMDTLFTLNQDEVMSDILMCIDASANNLEIEGFVNGENLTNFVKNTFMLSEDQYITGKMLFLNNVYMRSDFNVRYINNLDISKTISLNDDHPLTGNYIFDSPVAINGNLQIFGNLNDIDFRKWKSNVITLYKSLEEQVITGNWRIHGNVTFEQNVWGSSLINGVGIKELVDVIEEQNENIRISVSKKMKKLKNTCENLQDVLSKANNMLYKFKSFEYLAVLEFPYAIASIHHFDFNDIDYIMVNFETCQLRVLSYTNEGFVRAADVLNFGYVKQYITLNYENSLYFVTIGLPGCGRNSGNLWRLQNNKFKHILDLGNVTDAKKLGNDGFVIVAENQFEEWDVKSIHEKSLEPMNAIAIRERNVQFFSNEKDTLLASRDTIYGFPTEERTSNLEFEEYENPFASKDLVTFQVGIDQKEYILFYEERMSIDHVFICKNDLSQREILQSIYTHKPSTFFILNFDGFGESLLIFSENKRKLKIYNYMGIEGFKHHSNINIKVDRLYNFKLRKNPYLARKHYLGVIHDKKLTILEAAMYGEKLDSEGQLICEAASVQ